jgi:hypothetical protein
MLFHAILLDQSGISKSTSSELIIIPDSPILGSTGIVSSIIRHVIRSSTDPTRDIDAVDQSKWLTSSFVGTSTITPGSVASHRPARREQEFSTEASFLFSHSIRESTRSKYVSFWKRYAAWCHSEQSDPCSPMQVV